MDNRNSNITPHVNITQPVECFQINLDDLEKYLRLLENPKVDTGSNIDVSNYSGLKTEIVTYGLKMLYDGVKSGQKLHMNDLREAYSESLLDDLELLSKQKSFWSERGAPNFKESFYKEIQEENLNPEYRRSEEFKAFLEYCATPRNFVTNEMRKISAQNKSKFRGLYSSAIVSAQMLIVLEAQQKLDTDTLEKRLDEELSAYDNFAKAQTAKDLGVRSTILLKDQSDTVRVITLEEFKKLKSLTGEQRDFINTVWHQGLFGNGWFMTSLGMIQDTLMEEQKYLNANAGHSDFLIIDVSKQDTVKLYNQSDIRVQDMSRNISDFAQGILEVDVSALKGQNFVPGCASTPAKINIYISMLDKEMSLQFPETLSIKRGVALDQIRQNIIQDSAQAYINELVKADSKNLDYSLQALAVLYGKIEGNDIALNTILNSELPDTNKKAIIYNICNDNEPFLDSIKAFASEMLAREKSQLLENNALDNNFKNLMSSINSDTADNTLHKVISKIDKLEQEITNTLQDIATTHSSGSQPFEVVNLPQESEAVQNYCILEEDQEKRQRFANKQLEKYCKKHVTQTDQVTIGNLEGAFASILTPICQSDTEKQLLRQNITKAIQDFNYQPGATNYITNFVSYISSTLSSLRGSKEVENKADKFQEALDIVRKNLKISNQNPPANIGHSKRKPSALSK